MQLNFAGIKFRGYLALFLNFEREILHNSNTKENVWQQNFAVGSKQKISRELNFSSREN